VFSFGGGCFVMIIGKTLDGGWTVLDEGTTKERRMDTKRQLAESSDDGVDLGLVRSQLID